MSDRTTRLTEAVDAARTNVEPVDEVELTVEGMTCASCATRVERTLARQAGVSQAAVNFAAGRAHVAYRPQAVSRGELEEAVERIGYRIAPVAEQAQAEDVHGRQERTWWRRVQVAWPLGLAVLLLALLAGGRPWARWASLVLAVPVQFGAGWPFLVTAAERVRRLTANMDTLIALGTLTAFCFSVYELLAGGALYFDTAALIIAFIVLGRYLEARATGRASSAIRRLLELGAKQARLLTDAGERLVPMEQVKVGDLVRVRPGGKIPVDGEIIAGQPRSTSRC